MLFHALNNSLKDKLATQDEPSTLRELFSVAIHLDNRIRERNKDKSRRIPSVKVTFSLGPSPSQLPSPSQTQSDPEPMQIGRTW